MATVLLAYGTGEGQTAKVTARIAETLRERGHETTVVDVSEETPAVADADAVLVGASIHAGKHQSEVVSFVSDHREALAAVPTGFFQVSLSSVTDDEQGRAEAAGYVEKFIARTDWYPDRIALFGGALRYSEYGFLKRLLMKQIAKRATGGTDTSHDYEYTDWQEVTQFANDFAAFVEGRLGVGLDE